VNGRQRPLMRANILQLLIAIALLWFPRTWMRHGATLWRARRRRDTRATGSLDGSSLSARREFTKPRNYYDFFRAAAGTLALVGGFDVEAALRPDPKLLHPPTLQILGIQTVILLVAVLIQTVRYDRRLSLSAPVFFVTGIVAMLCPPWATVCGCAIAWLLTPIMPQVSGFLIVQALVIAGLGFVLSGLTPLFLFGIALCFLPILLSLLTRKPLTVFTRRGASSGLK
jgi:hypothetical protein